MKIFTLKNILRYLSVLALTILLGWWALQNLKAVDGESKAEAILRVWADVDKRALALVALLSVISHLVRAARWNMLLRSAHGKTSLGIGFMALMIGYLVNIVIPRGGEMARCYSLFSVQKTPVAVSFGTVVAERIIDVLCLGVLVGVSALSEWQKIPTLMDSMGHAWGFGRLNLLPYVGIVALLLFLFTAVYLLRKNRGIMSFVVGFRRGLRGVLHLNSPWYFVLLSLIMWGVYLAMSHYTMVAFPATESLGLSASLVLLVAGSLAVSIPLPAGIGSYHTLVPMALALLYTISLSEATSVVFVFHAWHTLLTLFVGLVCLLANYLIVHQKSTN